MALKSENDIWDSAELDENEFSIEDLEANLEAELEMQLSDLSVLEEEKEQIENPDNLCKVIMDEVWSQFANQIGLDMTNETLIQTYNREHPE